MARIQLDIPAECLRQLMHIATHERRTTRAQAELMLEQVIAGYCSPMWAPDVGGPAVGEQGREPSAVAR